MSIKKAGEKGKDEVAHSKAFISTVKKQHQTHHCTDSVLNNVHVAALVLKPGLHHFLLCLLGRRCT